MQVREAARESTSYNTSYPPAEQALPSFTVRVELVLPISPAVEEVKWPPSGSCNANPLAKIITKANVTGKHFVPT